MQCKGGFKEEEHLKGTVRDYNIHNIVTFKIVDQTNFLDKYLSNVGMQYKNFEAEKISNPDFIVYLEILPLLTRNVISSMIGTM